MNKDIEKVKRELKEQNDFLHFMLRSLEDIKQGRIKKFQFTKNNSA
ncbi:hypothetical protein J4437_07720 [Candidatus Woesearchaeota archaeon]|nr:hypothetical protein [Candidatus Woesearchaeota archaeon]